MSHFIENFLFAIDIKSVLFQAGGSYDAADEVVIEMLEKIGQLKLNPSTAESDEPDCDLRAVFEYYKAFLASSNHVDLFDVYAALVGEMEKESDLGQDLAATIVCCLGAPSTALEVLCVCTIAVILI